MERTRRPGRVGAAFLDLWQGLMRWRLWTVFAWENIQSTYHRTLFGALWISISFAAFVGVKLVIFGSLLGTMDKHYGAYLLLGFLSWSFVSQSVISATGTFISNESWIKNDPLPFSVYALQAVTQDLFSLLMTMLAAAGMYWITGQHLDWFALLVIPAIFVFLLNALWVKLFLGTICARFRDVSQLVSTIMRLMMFLTPIFWTPTQMGPMVMKYLWWNPFMHFLEIFRSPVLDHQWATESWIFVGVVTIIGWVLALVVFTLFRRRIPYWL